MVKVDKFTAVVINSEVIQGDYKAKESQLCKSLSDLGLPQQTLRPNLRSQKPGMVVLEMQLASMFLRS